MSRKRLVVPVCWAVYRIDAETEALLHQSSQLPPPIVLEALAMEGKVKREFVIHTLQIENAAHDHSEDTDGSDEEEGGDGPEMNGPWYKGDGDDSGN